MPENEYAMEIHFINVGGGDATAIVIKEKNNENKWLIIQKILIDAGLHSPKEYCTKYLGNSEFDYFICSHHHRDHLNGFNGITIKKAVDIVDWIKKGEKQINAVSTSEASPEYKKKVKNLDWFFKNTFVDSDNYQEGELINKDECVLALGKNSGVKLRFICANMVLADGTNIYEELKNEKSLGFSNNPHSIVMVLEWPEKDFRFYAGGDVTGKSSPHGDVEKYVIPYLEGKKIISKDQKKYFNVIKSSHHGSNDSNYIGDGEDNDLFTKLNPETIITFCLKGDGLPKDKFLNRLGAYCKSRSKKPTALFLNIFPSTSTKSIQNWGIADGAVHNLDLAQKNVMEKAHTAFIITVGPNADGLVPSEAKKIDHNGANNYNIFHLYNKDIIVKSSPSTISGREIKVQSFEKIEDTNTKGKLLYQLIEYQAVELTKHYQNGYKNWDTLELRDYLEKLLPDVSKLYWQDKQKFTDYVWDLVSNDKCVWHYSPPNYKEIYDKDIDKYITVKSILTDMRSSGNDDRKKNLEKKINKWLKKGTKTKREEESDVPNKKLRETPPEEE